MIESREPVNMPGYEMDEVVFKSRDGLSIPSYFFPADDPSAAVVTSAAGLHGSIFDKHTFEFDDFHLDIADYFTDNGVSVLYVDKRGSRGYNDEFKALNDLGGGEVDDVLSGSDVIRELSPVDERVFGYGVSANCVNFALAAMKDTFSFYGLALQAGFYEIEPQYERLCEVVEEYANELLGDFDADSFPFESRSPLNHIEKFGTDTAVLLVHGTNDGKVPYSQSEKFYEGLQQAGLQNVDLSIMEDFKHKKEAASVTSETGKPVIERVLNFVLSK